MGKPVRAKERLILGRLILREINFREIILSGPITEENAKVFAAVWAGGGQNLLNSLPR